METKDKSGQKRPDDNMALSCQCIWVDTTQADRDCIGQILYSKSHQGNCKELFQME